MSCAMGLQNRRWIWVGLVAGGLGACATQIKATKERPDPGLYVADDECVVRDYPGATDVPDGARNLGWVSVRTEESDEETLIKLRKKVCEVGGDAMSQVAWVRETGDPELRLKGNAWALP